MRSSLLATLAVLAFAAAGPAADPPVVFQTQPVGRVLDDIRGAANVIGGEKAVKELNDELKRTFGEKGLDGLDLTRPAYGYVFVPANPEESSVVVALPVTGEKEFLDLCERVIKAKPKAGAGGLYELPSPDPGMKAAMRIQDGFAYIAVGAKDPSGLLNPEAILPIAKVFDGNERGLVAAKVYFDRFPAELKAKALAGLNEAKAGLTNFPFPPDISEAAKSAFDEFTKMASRYLDYVKDAKEAVLRLNLDPATGDASVEAGLTANPGSALDKAIAERKPTTNAFAGVITPETVAGFKLQLPLFAPEIRNAAVIGLEGLQKAAAQGAPPEGKAMLDEVVKGAIRTVKTGEVDLAAGLRGPNKNGEFTLVAAVSFEDPSGMEKAIRAFIDADAPPEFKDALKYDAVKVGNVSIHTVDLAKAFPREREFQQLFGPNGMAAVAFAPKAIYAVVGPDALAVMKDLLGAKLAAPSPALDVVVNPARLLKLIEKMEPGAAAEVATILGKDDKMLSALNLSVDGGKQLTLKVGLNLKLLPRVARAGVGGGAAAPPAIKK